MHRTGHQRPGDGCHSATWPGFFYLPGWKKKCALGNGLGGLVRESLSQRKVGAVGPGVWQGSLRAVVQGDRESCRQAPSRQFLELAVQTMLRGSSASARLALKQGKLQGLGADVPRRCSLGARTSPRRAIGQAAGDRSVTRHHGERETSSISSRQSPSQ